MPPPAAPAAGDGVAAAGPWARLVDVLSVLGTALIMVVMLVMDGDVLGRALFGRPIAGAAEIVTMSIAAIVFLQLPAALAAGRFVRSDVLLDSIMSRRAVLGERLQALWCVLGAFTFVLLCHGAAPLVWKDWVRGEVYGSPGVFTFARWPVGLTVLLGCVVTAVQFALMAWRHARSARDLARELNRELAGNGAGTA